MDDILKRLLEAEARAEQIVASAKTGARAQIDAAAEQAQAAEQDFEARISEIHDGFFNQAGQRAEQTLGELQRRYHERSGHLRELAAAREDEALAAAWQVLLRIEEA